MENIPDYPVPDKIFDLISEGKTTDQINLRTNEKDYIGFFRMMIHLEEAHEQLQTIKCNRTNVRLHQLKGNQFYFMIEVS